MMEMYEKWQRQPTPDNMQNMLTALDPALTSEIQRFNGPQSLLKNKAKVLAIKAIKTYKPESGAQLKSWVTTQLQPLSRYANQLKPVYTPEVAVQHAAEVNRVREQFVRDEGKDPSDEELADITGLSIKRIGSLKSKVPVSISESTYDTGDDESSVLSSPAVDVPSQLSSVEEAVYDSLNDRDKAIHDFKVGRHGKPVLANQEIAMRLGISPAAVSQRSAQIANQIVDLQSRGGI